MVFPTSTESVSPLSISPRTTSTSTSTATFSPSDTWTSGSQLTRATTLDSSPTRPRAAPRRSNPDAQIANAKEVMLEYRRPIALRSASDPRGSPMAPALPESPEILVRAPKVLPGVPRSGTRSGPGPALGLFVPPPTAYMNMPGLPTPPLSAPSRDSGWPKTSPPQSFNSFHTQTSPPPSTSNHPVYHAQSAIQPTFNNSVLTNHPSYNPSVSQSTSSLLIHSSGPIHTQPLPALPGPRINRSTSNLGRKLPPTLTESLELLCQVREHCRELEKHLHSVPEEAALPPLPTPSASPTPLPRRQRSLGSGTALGIRPPPHTTSRRATEPSLPSLPIGALPVPPTSQPKPLRRRSSCSTSSSTSGDWPETPRTSVYGAPGCAESMPVFAQMQKPLEALVSKEDVQDLRTRLRAAQAMQSMVAETPKDRPSVAKLMYAAELELLDEDGKGVRFGDLVDSPHHSRTVVVFVRHWLSPSCASYLRALIAELTPTVLARSKARVVLIGHGAASMIKGFRTHLQCPFPVFTDPQRRLHDVLQLSPRPHGNFKSEFSTGSLKSAKEMLMGAARMHGLRAGNRQQLGGEFVFEGGLRVLFTHRMLGDGDHAPIRLVVGAVSAPLQRPPRIAKNRSSMYVTHSPFKAQIQPRATASSTSLADHGPRHLAFPLPPISPTSHEFLTGKAEWERDPSDLKRAAMRSNECVFVNSDDIERVSCELRALCAN